MKARFLRDSARLAVILAHAVPRLDTDDRSPT